MNKNVIEFNEVGLRYAQGPEILKGVTFSLPQGSFHFLTGESGAGKTSLLSLMYLDRRPTRGSVRLFGKDVDSFTHDELPQIRRRIGVVFQDFRLLDHLSAIDNVALPLRIMGVPEQRIKKDVTELLCWAHLSDHLNDTPPTLSGGQKQNIAIARAVINRPELLVADEPTGNLDDKSARRLLNLFVELNKRGTTVIIATHNEALIRTFPFPRLHLSAGSVKIYPAGYSPEKLYLKPEAVHV